jgi:hypothetical protein
MNHVFLSYRHESADHAKAVRNLGDKLKAAGLPVELDRSLVISYKLLGTREWFVIHHTDCGMETFTDQIIRDLLSKSLEQAEIDSQGWHDRGAGPGSDAGEFIDWLTIRDVHASVVTDVRRIRAHPLVPPTIPIYGYLSMSKPVRSSKCPRRQKSVRLLAPHDSRAVALYLNRRLSPFTALNSWTGSRSTGCKSCLEQHLNRRQPRSSGRYNN